ncbi:MAG: hypothetical protein DI539_27830 [Flavobacterium psychrophilum]|nr:MAG: hypothetical protein DI539_27830 [Flavobacterium psychrophilum]
MIQFKDSNLLQSEAQAFVNTVNLVGVMGKGIALQFKESFPLNYKLYKKACADGQLQIGKMFVTETGQIGTPKYIINFPTKTDWKLQTKIEYVEDGLDDLVKVIVEKDIRSIAIPPLGCGNGGLDWQVVRPLMEKKLASVSEFVTIEIYAPGHHSYARTTLGAEPPKLNKVRAIILAMAEKYNVLGFDISHLELQKLAYFLAEFGQPDLRLTFQKGTYGPYAVNLKHLLAHLEGHYIKGQIRFHDMRPTDSLHLVAEHLPAVHSILQQELSDEEKKRLEKVSAFIEGFESPLGLELLSTVYWTLVDLGSNATIAEIKSYIANWSSRKDSLMSEVQIAVALQRIRQFNA